MLYDEHGRPSAVVSSLGCHCHNGVAQNNSCLFFLLVRNDAWGGDRCHVRWQHASRTVVGVFFEYITLIASLVKHHRHCRTRRRIISAPVSRGGHDVFALLTNNGCDASQTGSPMNMSVIEHRVLDWIGLDCIGTQHLTIGEANLLKSAE